MKNLSQIQSIKERIHTLKIKNLGEDDEIELRKLEHSLRGMTTKKRFLIMLSNLCSYYEHKARIEELYFNKYICIYFKLNTDDLKNLTKKEFNDWVLTAKDLPKYVNKIENEDDKIIKYNSPTTFLGMVKDTNLIKLSIPLFIYENDLDIMNFINNRFKSFIRNNNLNVIMTQ